MGRLLKRKRKKEEEKKEIREVRGEQLELEEREKKQKKKEEAKGPTWGALALLAITIGAGLLFWVYGQLTGTGFSDVEWSEVKSMVEKEEEVRGDKPKPSEEKVDLNKKGVIIFEKE